MRTAMSVVLGVFLLSFAIAQNTSTVYDCFVNQGSQRMRFIFLVDISGSMEGKVKGSANVFPELKRILTHEYADSIPPGSEVWVVPFGEGIIKERERKFSFPEERKRYESYVYSLQADENWTYIYLSLIQVLQELKATSAGANTTPTAIYLFTDGIDNEFINNEQKRFKRFSQLTQLIRSFDECELPILYLISLNDKVPPPDNPYPGRIVVVRALDEDGKAVVPYTRTALFKPPVLNLGNLWDSRSASRAISARLDIGDSPALVQLSIIEDGQLSAQGAFLSVEPSEIKISPGNLQQFNLKFSLKNAEALKQGKYTAELFLQPVRVSSDYVTARPNSIKLNFEYLEPSTIRISPTDDYLLGKSAKEVVFDEHNRQATLSYNIKIQGHQTKTYKFEAYIKQVPPSLNVQVNGHSTDRAYIEIPPGKSSRIDIAFALRDSYSAETSTPKLIIRGIEPSDLSTEYPLPRLRILPPPVSISDVLLPLLFVLVPLAAVLLFLMFRNKSIARENCGEIEICIGGTSNCNTFDLGTYGELKHGISLGDFQVELGDIFIQAEQPTPCSLIVSNVPEHLRIIGAGTEVLDGDALYYGERYSVVELGQPSEPLYSFAVYEPKAPAVNDNLNTEQESTTDTIEEDLNYG
ncbi:MAG: VWA domain-containing protein [Gammaproteobacteria bacterium]|nr:VWA domain-containing protein [Gammaproteobacteria bacterium]